MEGLKHSNAYTVITEVHKLKQPSVLKGKLG
jgi:hypothetical protein